MVSNIAVLCPSLSLSVCHFLLITAFWPLHGNKEERVISFINKRCYDLFIPSLSYNRCNSHCLRKWTWRSKFRSRIQLFVYHFMLMTLEKAWNPLSYSPVNWKGGCKLHWLHLCRGVSPPTNEYLRYDT